MSTNNSSTAHVFHPQLSSATFGNTSSSDDEDMNEFGNDAPIVPAGFTEGPLTVRVERPLPPIDFVLSRPIRSLQELNEITFRPAALNTRVTCRICRTRDGLEKLTPQYQLYLEDLATGDMRYIMSARKKRKTQTSYYTITGNVASLASDASSTTKSVTLGKVRSNFLGTAFVIYSHGKNPFKQELSHEKKNLPVREELGAVLYDPNILGFKGPRKMTILTHTLSRDGRRPEFRPIKESQTLLAKHREGGAPDLLVLHNKSPQWNEETQSFVLNFNGRVTQASVKNFQIVHDNDLDYIAMQFGRIERDYFTMDYKYPFCLLQAFSIAITSFDAKLACE